MTVTKDQLKVRKCPVIIKMMTRAKTNASQGESDEVIMSGDTGSTTLDEPAAKDQPTAGTFMNDNDRNGLNS